MSLPSVNVIKNNDGLGQTVQTEDGVTGLLLQGVATPSLAVLIPKLITSLSDAVSLGIDEDYDTDNSVNVYGQLKEYYAIAGNGAQLYIMIVPQAVTVEMMLDKDEAYADKLLMYAQGKIRILGVLRNPANSYVASTATHQIDEDIINALTKGQVLAEKYEKRFSPIVIMLGAYGFTGDAGGLVDLKTFDKSNCAIILGGTKADVNAVGLLCGRLASTSVVENIGKVKSGSLPINEGFIGDEEYVDAQGKVEAASDKGFVSIRQIVGKAGFYFTDDPTAASSISDYNSIARNRVINKVIYIANQVYINEINSEIAIDPSTGRIQAVQIKYYESLIINAVRSGMVATSEISEVTANMPTDQDVLATNELCIECRIVPFGYAKVIKVGLGFTNPTN